jgi:transcriptional regulator GlxA family with amidase domain
MRDQDGPSQPGVLKVIMISLLKIALFATLVSILASAQSATSSPPQPPPRTINVAFVLESNATLIDFAGPWQVFQDVMLTKDSAFFDVEKDDVKDIRRPFKLYIVSEKRELISTDSGMKIMPDYTYADAPAPEIIVVPAEGRNSPTRDEWLKKTSKDAKLTMSVCTGAYILAKDGLLDGKEATTHHAFQDDFEQTFPKVRMKRGVRFVDNGTIATAGGLTSGIDLALHIVKNYFGPSIAQAEAAWLEYKGGEWR